MEFKDPPDAEAFISILIGQGSHLPMNNRLFGGDFNVHTFSFDGNTVKRVTDITKVKKISLDSKLRPCIEEEEKGSPVRPSDRLIYFHT